jgi:tRNA(fMet)-specific endonuclease VapC
MTYLLDTNACVDYLTGRYPAVADRIQRSLPADLCVSSIVAAELRYGADNSRDPVRNRSRLDILLGEIRCLDFDLAASAAYGALRVGLERRGQPIGAHDMLIAAHAISAGAVLVSDNVREFSRVKGLSVENWRR